MKNTSPSPPPPSHPALLHPARRSSPTPCPNRVLLPHLAALHGRFALKDARSLPPQCGCAEHVAALRRSRLHRRLQDRFADHRGSPRNPHPRDPRLGFHFRDRFVHQPIPQPIPQPTPQPIPQLIRQPISQLIPQLIMLVCFAPGWLSQLNARRVIGARC
mgnify:CR=1 FL=1